MAYCSQCGAEIPADAKTCPSCQATIGAEIPVQAIQPWDHTTEFDAKDISDNKVYALSAYALSYLGIIMCLLIAKDSPYAKFHAREAAKINIVACVISILTGVLCWTCIVPFAGIVFLGILFVLDIIAFVQVCKGQAKEPWMIRSIGGLH